MKTKYQRPKDIEVILEQLGMIQEARGEIVIPGLNSTLSERLKYKLANKS